MKKVVLLALLLFSFHIYAESPKVDTATFAGGCFWCMEHPFDKLEGVVDVVSGYTGGDKKNPTYKDVSSGRTKHVEAVEIKYDPSKIKYKKLLEVFWVQIDPTDATGSFADRGYQYRSEIFYHNIEQKKIAEESKAKVKKSGIFDKKIVTSISPAKEFYRAEEYHQDYYKKNKIRYKIYRRGSGRDQFIKRVWTEENKAKIK